MLFFFNDTATTEIYTLSLHDALPICRCCGGGGCCRCCGGGGGGCRCCGGGGGCRCRSEEDTSGLPSLAYIVCRLLLGKKKKAQTTASPRRQPHRRLIALPVRSWNERA